MSVQAAIDVADVDDGDGRVRGVMTSNPATKLDSEVRGDSSILRFGSSPTEPEHGVWRSPL